MMFIRFILYSILAYLVLKTVGVLWRYFNQLSEKNNPSVSNSKKKEYTINKKDIIDAEFEDITDKENTKDES